MADPSDDELVASSLIPQLPDDVSVQCIARVPRSSYPALALVSRSWRSLLRSRRLFTLRSHLGVTEPSLCINLCNYSGESGWYFLNRHHCRFLPLPPNPFPTSGCGCRLLPVSPNPFPTFESGCAVLGSSLYVLGGYHPRFPRSQDDNFSTQMPSSAVQIFDPCLNLWTTGPPMSHTREFPAASALGGRIYVFDGRFSGCHDPESGAWTEVLDPAAGAWASLPRMPTQLRIVRTDVFRGQILLNVGLVLDPEAAQPWGTMSEVLRSKWASWGDAAVVLDGVLYTHDSMGELGGYDFVADDWKPVVGVEGVLDDVRCPGLTNLGGMLCLVWVEILYNGEQSKPDLEERIAQTGTPDMRIQEFITCVGIEITRTNCGGLRGSVAWREVVDMPISDGMLMHSVVLEF